MPAENESARPAWNSERETGESERARAARFMCWGDSAGIVTERVLPGRFLVTERERERES